MNAKIAKRAAARIDQTSRGSNSTLRGAKKLSATALSTPSPTVPIAGRRPAACRRCPKAREVYGQPRSPLAHQPGDAPASAPLPGRAQLDMDARAAVSAPARLMAGTNALPQMISGLGPDPGRARLGPSQVDRK